MNFLKKLFNTKTTITTTLTVTSSNGFHLRPIAKFVAEAKRFDATITLEADGNEVSATQVPNILSLSLEQGDSFQLKCRGKEAKEASEELSQLFKELMRDDKEVEEIKQEEEEYEANALRGETIAKGVAIAPMVQYEKVEQKGDGQGVPLQEALQETKKELDRLYHRNREKDEAQIFLAQKELLNSELFEKNFHNIEKEIEALKGTKFESRISDYRDLKERILGYMGRVTKLNLPTTPYILLADDLIPSDIGEVVKTPIQGVILQKGTATSHASILLRAEAIPSMIINEEVTMSQEAILDANSGNLILEPSKNDLEKARKRQNELKKEQERSYKNRFEITKTKEGKKIQILANIADIESAKEAKEQGADGIGLFRTEFLFTKDKPTLKEQIEAYSEIFNLFDEITIRTLDIGGDKSLPYIEIPKEDNPFLGLRGIRFSLQEQTLFKEQLLAIFKAVGSISSNKKTIKIMFPMVSTTQEFIQAKEIAQNVAKESNLDISNIQFGIMLEVPSVIFALKEFDTLVDFYSIGSNDLTQYLFAIERTHPTLSVDATSPLLMNALRYIKEHTEKPISICGEVAGQEEVSKTLIDMNYHTLSVSAKLIPSLKEHIRKL